jgi:hypothetical protein
MGAGLLGADVNVPTTATSAIQYVSSSEAGQASVSGSSTVHDWMVKGVVIDGNAMFSGRWKVGSSVPIELRSIDLAIPVASLKGTEGSGMDGTMYESLKRDQFPSITFKLTQVKLKTEPSGQGLPYHFATRGQLAVAGIARTVNLDLTILPHDDGALTIATNVSLNMSDFNIAPPTAMLGAIKSGDAIVVRVIWQLSMTPAKRSSER